MSFIVNIFLAAWHLLVESSVYIIFGLIVGGFLQIFLRPDTIARHLGHGRFRSVFKAALLGIPIPLCSCGVLPTALSLKKQGANNGATTAFMISTPESGVDSIAITYALMDPIMTIARPVSAFLTAMVAGILENIISFREAQPSIPSGPSPSLDSCCNGNHNHSKEFHKPPSFIKKLYLGFRYALEFWGDLAGWFLIGILIAGVITSLIPDDIFARYFGSGLSAMLFMLVIGIPLFICATASTPIAAALILKGVSPGAALVFPLAGPATNAASLTVLMGILGKRATIIYLTTIAVAAVICGLAVEQVYGALGLSAQAMVGQASEIIPAWAGLAGAVILLLFSVKPVTGSIMKRFHIRPKHNHESHIHPTPLGETCASASPAGSP
ncbi:hypothetical protein C6A37_06185 [Desulfobacteraceae bacterium SEEP-SAG9]|nr:hypothetical protein C6A37_06185 [Desulfobacteraceae bacterium SEEP-SAG9]